MSLLGKFLSSIILHRDILPYSINFSQGLFTKEDIISIEDLYFEVS